MEIRRWLVAGLLFGVLWLFVQGPVVAIDAIVTTFIVGMAVGLPVAFVFRRLYEEEIDVLTVANAVPYTLLYVFNFSREVLVANLDVAYRVLAPDMPLEPQVILVPLRVETAVGVTTIANSITITPGTVTLDHDPDENALYVHIIDGRNPEEVVGPIRQWEDYALEIFDEPKSPDDPPREIRIHPPDYPPEPKKHATQVEEGESTSETSTEEKGGEDQ